MASLSPTYLSTLFPNGLPQTNTTTAPTSGYTGAQVSDAPSTSSITSAIMSALQPQFAQQDSAETEALADAGIVGGSTTGALGALGQQQQTQAASSIAPYIMQGYQLQQNDALANQASTNSANQFDAGALNQGGEFNSSALNAGDQFNIQNELEAAQYDSGLDASQSDYLAGLQNQDYLAQLGMQGNLISSSAGAQTSAYQPIYSQPSAPNFSGIAGAFAPTAKATTPTSTNGGFAYDPGAYDSGNEASGDY